MFTYEPTPATELPPAEQVAPWEDVQEFMYEAMGWLEALTTPARNPELEAEGRELYNESAHPRDTPHRHGIWERIHSWWLRAKAWVQGHLAASSQPISQQMEVLEQKMEQLLDQKHAALVATLSRMGQKLDKTLRNTEKLLEYAADIWPQPFESRARFNLPGGLRRVYGPLLEWGSLDCTTIFSAYSTDLDTIVDAAQTLGIHPDDMHDQLPCDDVSIVNVPARPRHAQFQFVVLMHASVHLGGDKVRTVVERAQWLTENMGEVPLARRVLPCIVSPRFTSSALQLAHQNAVLTLEWDETAWKVLPAAAQGGENPALRACRKWVGPLPPP